jgi:hypothetical protein
VKSQNELISVFLKLSQLGKPNSSSLKKLDYKVKKSWVSFETTQIGLN